MIRDMTTGSPARLLLCFSIPLLAGNVFQQLYTMADTIIVGRTVSVGALAAVGATGALCFLVFGFFFGLTGGFAVVTGQRFGARDYDGVRRSVAASTLLCAAISVVITILSLATARPLLTLMNTPEDIFDDAEVYLSVLYWGIAATVFYNMLSSIIRALGDSRTPLVFLIFASGLNIVLDLVFILNFGWGVAGAAWATVASQAVSGGLCLWFVARKFPILKLRRSDWRIDRGFLWEHLRIGMPMALQFAITAIGVVVMQAALNAYGTTTVAAFAAAARIEQLAVQPLFAVGITMATFGAQNFGAGRLDRIRIGVRQCSWISTAYCLCGGFALWLGGPWMVELFVGSGEEAVLRDAQVYLNCVALFFVILGQLFVYRNVLQGMGYAFVPMMAGVIELVVRMGGSHLLSEHFGYAGVCLVSPFAWVGATSMLAVFYYCRAMREYLPRRVAALLSVPALLRTGRFRRRRSPTAL